MFQAQKPKTDTSEFSRCEEEEQTPKYGKSFTPFEKSDAEIKEKIYHALWSEDALRVLEFSEIDVHVKNGVVHLNGHILSTTSQSRVESALQDIPGILELRNNLVLDDKLTVEVATALGPLENTYGCKFFTGASHGVISLNGKVENINIKLLAEQYAAQNPNVRGVINNIQVDGLKPKVQDQPFLQPTIGMVIYFLDGISGVVKQVAINPNNRRVTAMIIQGRFGDQDLDLKSMNSGETRPLEQRITVPIKTVRYLTKNSGFLNIRSYDSGSFMVFDTNAFIAPTPAWAPPYPYCPDNILFPIKYQDTAVALEDELLKEESHVNDSPGG